MLRRCIFGELLSGGHKLFRSDIVTEPTEGKVGDKRRRSEVETGSEDDDGDESVCAGISSASSSRVRTGTLISSLRAIFEVLYIHTTTATLYFNLI
jgi:hypothetical protein